jgi:hypothetical protein
VESSAKSPASESQAHSPSVTTGMIRATGFVATQCSISRLTQGERAASGDAISTKYSESSIARSIDDHSSGVTARPV